MQIFTSRFKLLVAQAETSGRYTDAGAVRALLAAVRGPDSQIDAYKYKFTAPIRKYVFTKEAYELFEFAPSDYAGIETLTKERVVALWQEADGIKEGHGHYHYRAHIRQALEVIYYHELWGVL